MRLSVRLASLGARQKNTLYADVRRRLYPKNSKRDTIKVFKSIVKRYEDFQNYLALNQLDSWLEMDIVMGITGGKVLLTFNLSFCNFIFARLLDNKTALEVTKHLYDIKNTLHQADKDFCQLFPVILTDNVESLPGLMTSKWMCEERVNSSFVTLIALTRKGELRKITHWFATFYLRELPLIT